MVDILPRDLPARSSVSASAALIMDDGTGVYKSTPAQIMTGAGTAGAAAVRTSSGQSVQQQLDASATALDGEVSTRTTQVAALDTRVDSLEVIAAAGLGMGGGLFESTADALSKGVIGVSSLVAGTGGTNGTFALAFTGGAGAGAAGQFVVAGGVITEVTITAAGVGYTSAPTVSFAASTGLTGASAIAIIDPRTHDGDFFLVVGTGDVYADLWQNVAGSAVDQHVAIPSYAALEDFNSLAAAAGAPNAWPDPFAEQIEDAAYVQPYAVNANRSPSWVGTLNRPSDYAGFGKTGIIAQGGANAVRAISLADLGLVIGDSATFRVAFNGTAGGNQAFVRAYNASGDFISQLEMLSGVPSGYHDVFGTFTIPANTHEIWLVTTGEGTTEIIGVGAANSALQPRLAYAAQTDTNSIVTSAEALNTDPFFEIAAAIPGSKDHAGNPLIGKVVGAGSPATLIASPALSLFPGKAVQFAAGITTYDFIMPASDLGLRIGEPIEVLLGVIAKQSLQAIAVLDGPDAASDSVRFSPAVDGAYSYGELPMTVIADTRTRVLATTDLVLRIALDDPAVSAGVQILGWRVSKRKGRLTNTGTRATQLALQMASASGSLAAGMTYVQLGDSISYYGKPGDYVANALGVVAVDGAVGGTTLAYRPGGGNLDAYSAVRLADSIAASVSSDPVVRAAAWDAPIAAAAASGDPDKVAAINALATNDWSVAQKVNVAFGTNDQFLNVTLGTLGDTTPTTLYGAMRYFCTTVRSAAKWIDISFSGPPYRWYSTDPADAADISKGSGGATYFLEQLSDAMKDAAYQAQAPFLDRYHGSGIDDHNILYLLPDGTHPIMTVDGHAVPSPGAAVFGRRQAGFIAGPAL